MQKKLPNLGVILCYPRVLSKFLKKSQKFIFLGYILVIQREMQKKSIFPPYWGHPRSFIFFKDLFSLAHMTHALHDVLRSGSSAIRTLEPNLKLACGACSTLSIPYLNSKSSYNWHSLYYHNIKYCQNIHCTSGAREVLLSSHPSELGTEHACISFI